MQVAGQVSEAKLGQACLASLPERECQHHGSKIVCSYGALLVRGCCPPDLIMVQQASTVLGAALNSLLA